MASSSVLVARTLDVGRLVELRRRVLRGGDPDATVVDPRDTLGDTLHVGVMRAERLVGVGSFYRASSPVEPERVSAQLRFLATEPTEQRHGVGSLLMRAAESHLTSAGVEAIWANARDSALGFYEIRGWTALAGSQHLSSQTNLPHTVVTKRLRRDDELTVGWAGVADATVLAHLREEMYFAINLRDYGMSWIEESARFFAEGLGDSSLLVTVARTPGGEVVSCAAASLRRVPPLPRFPHGTCAYVHSVSTHPGFRRRGVAREVVRVLIDELALRGVERVELHATAQGGPMYRELGFLERTGSPELRLGLHETPVE